MICDGCGCEKPTEECWFQGKSGPYKKDWCQECSDCWKNVSLSLLSITEEEIKKIKEDSMTPWDKLKRWWKTL